jgi:hypothetical protein
MTTGASAWVILFFFKFQEKKISENGMYLELNR